MRKMSFLRGSVLVTVVFFVFFGNLSNLLRTMDLGWEKISRKFAGENGNEKNW